MIKPPRLNPCTTSFLRFNQCSLSLPRQEAWHWDRTMAQSITKCLKLLEHRYFIAMLWAFHRILLDSYRYSIGIL